MKQDILVPFDGSANAEEALRVAIDMAKAFNEKIVLLNIQPSFETPHTKKFFNLEQFHEFRLQTSAETIQPAENILKQAGVKYTTKMRVGDPREKICLEARADSEEGAVCKDRGVRLIVMGSRGLNPLIGTVLGSVSMGVLHNAPCPITIVPYSC